MLHILLSIAKLTPKPHRHNDKKMALVAAAPSVQTTTTSFQESSTTSHLYTHIQTVEQKVRRQLSNDKASTKPPQQTKQAVARKPEEHASSTSKWQCVGKIPLPVLEATLATYLKDLEAIEYDQEKLESARQAVQQFLETDGYGIQVKLRDYAEKHECWPHDMWLQDMYFRVPLPLVVNSNPGMIFPPISIESDEHWLRFAARLITATLDFKDQIDNQLLEQDVSRQGSLLCMEQYCNVFTCYRRAGADVDERVVTPANAARHIIVAYKGQFVKLQVLEESDHSRSTFLARSLDDLCADLQDVIRLVDNEIVEQHEVGLFTAQDRRVWSRIRQQLLEVDDQNEASGKVEELGKSNYYCLRCIEQSLFVLCLDDAHNTTTSNGLDEMQQTAAGESSETEDDKARTQHLMRMIHGQGPTMDTKNRWFEKSLQLILARDGKWGWNYEHSTAEAMPLVRMAEHVVKRVFDAETSGKRNNLSSMLGEASHLDVTDCFSAATQQLRNSILTPPPEHQTTVELLKFDFGKDQNKDFLTQALAEAKVATKSLVDATDLRVFTFREFGKNIPKLCRASPDCFVQLALQLAHYRCHQKLVATYESASIRAFHHGRVDVIRSATREAYDWVRLMTADDDGGEEGSREKLVLALRTALKRQTQQMQLANSGHGIDNHLMALREFAMIQANNDATKLPELFRDEGFKNFMTFAVSTSQVPTSMPNCCLGYGPVVPHGYGCSYNIHEDNIIFVVSSFRTCETTDTVRFYNAIAQALRDMKSLLLAEN